MKDLIEINDNMGRNIEYSIDFFLYSDYELQIDKPTMMEDDSWLTFLNNTDKLSIPLKAISSFTQTQKIWSRNTKQFDKMVVEIDNSLDNNIIEFIAKKTQYGTIRLNDLKKLGCIIWMNYIDNNGFQKKERLYVGRPSINTYTDDKLSLTIKQLNQILTGSDFEKNVTDDITSAFYSFISLKQAFERIYNIPRNVINRFSYPATPFRLDESNYVPELTQDIILTGDNLPIDSFIYAEDTVANTDKNIHCQFYYKLGSPQCGFKMTEYNELGNVVTVEDVNVMNWNVWGNTEEALNLLADGFYLKDAITNYQRYFRPFKVVIAGQEELDMLNQGQYRIRRDIVWGQGGDLGERREDWYEPNVQNNIFRQEEIRGGDYACRVGDKLVYFEVLGDIRVRDNIQNQESANILYDNYSTVYVYNLNRDIVYFDHVTRFVQTIPLPKQWLDMKQFIRTEKILYSSSLDYESLDNLYSSFLSQIKPMCSLPRNNGSTHGLRYEVASSRSLKVNQDNFGFGGYFVGEKMISSLGFGTLDIEIQTDYDILCEILDSITLNNKPKSIRLSDDGMKIYYLKNTESGFAEWPLSWNPTIVKGSEYTKVNEIPKIMKYAFKYVYKETFEGFTQVSKKEFDGFRYITFGNENEYPLINEVTDRLNDNSVVLMSNPIYSTLGVYVGGNSNIVKCTDNFRIESTKKEFTEIIIPSANILNYETDSFWSYNNIIYKNLEVYKTYDVTWYVLDYNKFIEKAIIQTPTELIYYDVENDVVLFNKLILGFDYILSMKRDVFNFTNPIYLSSDQIIRIASSVNENVRLLSFSGNRYLAGERLASSFIKNSYYDGDGVLNIGFIGEKYELTDYSVIKNSIDKYKYDSIEYIPKKIEKSSFTSIDSADARTKEEDELEYDKSISINMWANKDIQMDFEVNRTSSTEITWTASTENQSDNVSGTLPIVGFDFFEIDLTGIYTGITITCDFYGTELAQGEKFRGTINRKKYIDSTTERIIDVNEDFPFLDDEIFDLNFPFLDELYKDSFYDEMKKYFVINDDNIREFVDFTIEVPTLLFFNTAYKRFTVNSLITLYSESKYVNGYSLDDGIITSYDENKCDYYIESMIFDMKNNTTKLKLISV